MPRAVQNVQSEVRQLGRVGKGIRESVEKEEERLRALRSRLDREIDRMHVSRARWGILTARKHLRAQAHGNRHPSPNRSNPFSTHSSLSPPADIEWVKMGRECALSSSKGEWRERKEKIGKEGRAQSEQRESHLRKEHASRAIALAQAVQSRRLEKEARRLLSLRREDVKGREKYRSWVQRGGEWREKIEGMKGRIRVVRREEGKEEKRIEAVRKIREEIDKGYWEMLGVEHKEWRAKDQGGGSCRGNRSARDVRSYSVMKDDGPLSARSRSTQPLQPHLAESAPAKPSALKLRTLFPHRHSSRPWGRAPTQNHHNTTVPTSNTFYSPPAPSPYHRAEESSSPDPAWSLLPDEISTQPVNLPQQVQIDTSQLANIARRYNINII